MAKIIMDEMKRTRDSLRTMLTGAQEACRLTIRLVHGEEEAEPLVTRILKLEETADNEMVRITEELTEIVGKLFLAGLLKRAVVCDSVVAHDTEAMLDLLQSVTENWMRMLEQDPGAITDEIRILLDSMLQNCIVMLEKAIDILDGRDISEHTLKFIMEVDGNINQANLRAHETLLLDKGEKRTVIRMIRIVKSIENLGDKIKSVASYLLFIRTGEFIKV
jgi:phosphate uptake regulator